MEFFHSKSRLEALSDGVFAFAATLMVIDIGSSTEIISFSKELPNFISFAISFFVMMMIWKVHYNFFRRTDYIDNWIIAFNMILLFTVLFYIFPLKSLLRPIFHQNRINQDQLAQLFFMYSFGFLFVFLSFVLMYWRAYKKDINSEKIKLLFYTRHFLIFVVVAFSSIILTYFRIGLQLGVPGFVYATLGIFCYIHGVRFKKRHGALN